MAKTESTAINSLIELQANATPLPPAPGEDLMFAEPAKKPGRPVSNARMSSTLTNAAPVEPLPRGRGASGTQENSVGPQGVRVTNAQPSRSMTIPPMAPPPLPTKSSASITPPIPTRPSGGTVPPPLPTRSSAGLTRPVTTSSAGIVPPVAASSAGTVPPPLPTRSSAGLTPPSTLSSAGIVPPARSSRPLPPPRPSAAMAAAVSGAPLLTPPPTDPSFDPAPIAPIDLTDQSWFEDSRAVDKVSPVSESTWVGTVQVPKAATTAQWLGKLAVPMGAMVVVGIFVGGYVAFDGQGGHKRTPVASSAAAPSETGAMPGANPASASGAAPAAPSETGANAGSPSGNAVVAGTPSETAAAAAPSGAGAVDGSSGNAAVAATPSETAAAAAPSGAGAVDGSSGNAAVAGTPSEAAAAATPSANAAAAVATTTSEKAAPPVATTAAPAVTPPNLAATSAVPAVTTPVAKGKSVFVDVRLDSQPSGATVMLVDRGKTMFLGTTPISTALDPARQYDVVFTYKDRPTVLEHVDPRTQSKVMVTLHHAKSYVPKAETARATAPKAEAPKAVAKEAPKAETPKAVAKEAPKAETPKAGIPKAELPKAEAPKAVAKEAPKAETPKAGGEGVLMVSSKPPCEIYIDGKPTGLTTPQRSLPLPAGTHKVTLINATEKIKKTLTVQITADQPTKLIQDLMAK